jgi:hypothetical protein
LGQRKKDILTSSETRIWAKKERHINIIFFFWGPRIWARKKDILASSSETRIWAKKERHINVFFFFFFFWGPRIWARKKDILTSSETRIWARKKDILTSSKTRIWAKERKAVLTVFLGAELGRFRDGKKAAENRIEKIRGGSYAVTHKHSHGSTPASASWQDKTQILGNYRHMGAVTQAVKFSFPLPSLCPLEDGSGGKTKKKKNSKGEQKEPNWESLGLSASSVYVKN